MGVCPQIDSYTGRQLLFITGLKSIVAIRTRGPKGVEDSGPVELPVPQHMSRVTMMIIRSSTTETSNSFRNKKHRDSRPFRCWLTKQWEMFVYKFIAMVIDHG